jgi:hypothetical protein
MAHYAYLDENDIVTQVIVGKNEGEDGINWEEYYGAKRTSYNTRGGIYYDPDTGEPSIDQSKAFRKNYAGIGYRYDRNRDAFISPSPFQSWTLNEQTCQWDPPVPRPEDDISYVWFEPGLRWIKTN